MKREYGIVCHSHDERSVCLSVDGRKQWYRIGADAQGREYCTIAGERYQVGTCNAWHDPVRVPMTQEQVRHAWDAHLAHVAEHGV